MNVRFDLKNLFANNNSAMSMKNIEIRSANPSTVENLTQASAIDEHAVVIKDLAYSKKVLKSTLATYSPQALNDFTQSTVDNRLQFYSYNDRGDKEVHEAFVDKVTRRVNYGKEQGESVKELNSLMDRISQGAEAAYSETRSVLEGLSKLSPDVESYIAESQSYTRFAFNELNSQIGKSEKLDFLTEDKKDFSLLVTTKEGDEVSINIQQSTGNDDLTYGSQISVNYEVEGDLSASEQQALSELMNAIGSASDSLLAGNDLTRLMGIDAFDGGQLADFSLTLEGGGQDIHYNYSQNGDTQNLHGNWQQHGVAMAEFNLSSKFGGTCNDEQLAQYLQLLDEAADATHKNNKVEKDQTSGLFKNTLTDFMNLAETMGNTLNEADKVFEQSRDLANTLFTEMAKEKSDRLGLKDEEQARLKEGFNRLADFSAQFVALDGGVRGRYRKSGYEVDLRQQTEVVTEKTKDGHKQAVKQTRNVFFDSVMAAGSNQRDHTLTEQYEIKAAIEKGTLAAIKQQRSATEHFREKLYIQGGESTFHQLDRVSNSENSLYFLKEGDLEFSQLEGGERTTKAIMAGEHIISQQKNSENYHYNEALFTSKDYRDASKVAVSLESQKRLLDALLDKL